MKPIKGISKKQILEKFTGDLKKISQAFSEMEMYRYHAQLDQWIDMQHKYQKRFRYLNQRPSEPERPEIKRINRELIKLLTEMQHDLIQLERCLEMGFKIYLYKWEQVAEPYQHELDEELRTKEEKLQDVTNFLNTKEEE